MSLLNHHVLLTCLTDHISECMLSEEIVMLRLLHVLKCVLIQSCELKDPQTAGYTTWKCIGSMHVYYDRPSTGDGINPKLGLKQYYYAYNECGGDCGPNYCCCVPV